MKLSELAAANDVLDDPPARAERYGREGCLLVRGALPADLVGVMRRQLWEVLHGQGLSGPPAADLALTGDGPRWNGTPVGCWDSMEADAIPALADLVEGYRSPASPVRTLVEKTRGHPAYLYRGSSFFISFPDNPAHVTPPHQDGWAGGADGDYRRVWIAITDIPFGDGGLALAPGSHRLGHLPRRDFPELSDRPTPESLVPDRRIGGVDPSLVDDQWASAALAPGDALVFHHDLLHRGLLARSDRVRIALTVMTSGRDDPHPTANDFTKPELLARKRALWRIVGPLDLGWEQRAAAHRYLLEESLPVNELTVAQALAASASGQ